MCMTTLTICNIAPAPEERLRMRAARHGRKTGVDIVDHDAGERRTTDALASNFIASQALTLVRNTIQARKPWHCADS
jgi:plasmid stability protein